MWMPDTDYHDRNPYPPQVFFPMAGATNGRPWLTKNLKPEIDEELIEPYRGTTSLSSAPGNHNRVALKIIDDRDIESWIMVEVGT